MERIKLLQKLKENQELPESWAASHPQVMKLGPNLGIIFSIRSRMKLDYKYDLQNISVHRVYATPLLLSIFHKQMHTKICSIS